MNEECVRRFDESYDDDKSGGYRDLSLSVEVSLSLSISLFHTHTHTHTGGDRDVSVSVEMVLPALRSISTGSLSAWYPAPLPQVQSVKAVALAGVKACEILPEHLFVSGISHLRAGLKPQTLIAHVGGVGDE